MGVSKRMNYKKAVDADHLEVEVASVTNDHTLFVTDNATGLLLGAVSISSVPPPPGFVSIPLTPVPHSDDVTLRIECTASSGGDIGILGVNIPHDTMAPYNLTSTACTPMAIATALMGSLKTMSGLGWGITTSLNFVVTTLELDGLLAQIHWLRNTLGIVVTLLLKTG